MNKQHTSTIKQFFDKAAASWDTYNGGETDKLVSLLKAAHFPSHAKVLDVACGTGVMVEPVLTFQPIKLLAMDISPAMIEILESKYSALSCLQAAVQDFYLYDPDEQADVLIVYNAYPHFIDKQRFSAQIIKCLRPGGRFIIAHGSGRQVINSRHDSLDKPCISTPLLSCSEEASRLGSEFVYDVMLETEDYYILSGTTK
ncbi:class I SAM-dependent methyltransferase [Eubacteriales bacterium OttesenSCG-928-K08]|nr:class I SAM-dependent methyltransferase [Eubacteriales bacterium OttesenSCG-928-K08]